VHGAHRKKEEGFGETTAMERAEMVFLGTKENKEGL